MADLEYGVENGVATILLNRPEKKNAFTTEMLDEWSEILVEARTDDGVGVIILTGAGDAFCSGGDFESRLAEAISHAPAFTLRGGTSEILRGIVARGLNIR